MCIVESQKFIFIGLGSEVMVFIGEGRILWYPLVVDSRENHFAWNASMVREHIS